MNNNLLPELRPDKNGKMVTRHVRSGGGVSDSAKSIPTPQLQKPSEPSEKLAYASETMALYMENALEYDRHNQPDPENEWDDSHLDYDVTILLSPDDTREAILALPESTGGYIHDKLKAGPFNEDYKIALMHALTEDAEDTRLLEYLTFYHNRVMDLTLDEDVLGDDSNNSYTIIKGTLIQMDRLLPLGYEPPEKIFEASDDEVELLVDLKSIYERNFDPRTGRSSEELLKYMIDNPSNAREAALIAFERNTDNVDLIKDVLNNHSAITEGTL